MNPNKHIHKRPPVKDNFEEWCNCYNSMMYSHYLDFTKLFENNPPSFLTFMEYCYNNTSSYYNHRKNKYECRIYR